MNNVLVTKSTHFLARLKQRNIDPNIIPYLLAYGFKCRAEFGRYRIIFHKNSLAKIKKRESAVVYNFINNHHNKAVYAIFIELKSGDTTAIMLITAARRNKKYKLYRPTYTTYKKNSIKKQNEKEYPS